MPLNYPSNVDLFGNLQVSSPMDGADGYGRVRVVTPFVLFASSLDLSDDASLFNASTATGGTGTYNSTKKRYDLAVTTSSGSQSLRESKVRGYLQPGRTCVAIQTALFASGQTNTDQRVGVFTDNNGAFWVLNGTTLKICTRNKVSGSVVDTTVSSSSFNIDKLDGSGPSTLTIDLTKIQQWVVEWSHMSAGLIRFGVIYQGRVVWAHYVDQNNVGTEVFMQSGTLPLRCEIINTGVGASAKTMVMGNGVILSDGEPSNFGKNFGINLGLAPKTVPAQGTGLGPIFLIRLKSGSDFGQMILKSMGIACSTNGGDALATRLILNPTLTGGTSPTYNSVATESAFEFDIACTSVVTGGTVLANYITSGGVSSAGVPGHVVDLAKDFDKQMQIFKSFAGTQDVLCLASTYHNSFGGGGAPNVYATLNWKELDG